MDFMEEVVFYGGSPANTARDVTLPADENGTYTITVTNACDSPLTVHVKVADPVDQSLGGTDHFPEVESYEVAATTTDDVHEVEWDLSKGGRLTFTLNEAIPAQSRAVTVRISKE